MDDLLAQFVIEAAELTQQAAEDLLALEREPGNRARLDGAFRAIHTLKGSVGLFDLVPMQTALHATEDALGRAMREKAELDPAGVDPMLAVIAWVERCVQQLQRSGSLGPGASEESAMLVRALGPARAEAPLAAALTAGALPDWAARLFEAHPAEPGQEMVALRYAPAPDCFFNGDDPVLLMAGVPGIVFARIAAREGWAPAAELDPFRSNLVFEALSTAGRAEIEAAFRLVPDQIAIATRAPQAATRDAGPEESGPALLTMRVDMARIDDIVALVGELLTAKNGMSRLIAQAQALEGGLGLSRSLNATQQELGRLIGQLQHASIAVRMVPLDETLRRLARLAREISKQTGKPIELEVSGGAIEADKAIVDGLYEPLLHIIRNAADHGIESEEGRRSAGKPATGKITVAARQAGHRIELQVSDDGKGIAGDAVRAAALARGLISQEAAAALGEDDMLELLFIPGFSTSRTVSELSGRGVGMDAVRAAVRRLGGRVAIASAQGAGTSVTLSLPTSFTISRIMLVTVAGEIYGVPMDAVAESIRVPTGAIVPVRSGEAFVSRERTIPLVRLGEIVGRPAAERAEELVLVVELGSTVIGLVVDGIGERFETLLRPPAGLLKAVRGIAGTTVLGDGRIVMVLDLEALVA